jgi:hypothetical protein
VSDPISVDVGARATIEYSNKKVHLIIEYRSDELKVCVPKIVERRENIFWKHVYKLHHYATCHVSVQKLR